VEFTVTRTYPYSGLDGRLSLPHAAANAQTADGRIQRRHDGPRADAFIERSSMVMAQRQQTRRRARADTIATPDRTRETPLAPRTTVQQIRRVSDRIERM
jgi:hypothetical protein